MARTVAEVAAVAAAEGIGLAEDPRARVEAVATATAQNRASMLQDLDRGVPTEIEFLNGAVVREARRLKVAAPVNEWLWRSVRAREATGLSRASLSA
jgi:2-dehydropantoate 2-reductase